MGRIAFVFPGQGAQYSGMGRELSGSSKAAADIFRAADALRPGTSAQCFNGGEDELRETQNTQPCMFAVEMACAAALSENGVRADMAAGFSLGELSALACAGAADFRTGFNLVCARAKLMQGAASARPAAMAAVLRLSGPEIERIRAGFPGVYAVNYNCPGQVSIAGPEEAMPGVFAAVKAAGGRAVPLRVSGGFHSPFMAHASEAFAEELRRHAVAQPEIPVYSNLTGEPYSGDIKDLMAKQICSPVQWEKLIRNMINAGADTFIEPGPGSTLCGLIGKIDGTVRCFGMSGPKDLNTILAEVKTCWKEKSLS